MQAFLENKPLLSEFDGQIRYYQELELLADELPSNYTLGAVTYMTEPLKRALKTETGVWKQAYGRALANKVCCFHFLKGMNNLSLFLLK